MEQLVLPTCRQPGRDDDARRRVDDYGWCVGGRGWWAIVMLDESVVKTSREDTVGHSITRTYKSRWRWVNTRTPAAHQNAIIVEKQQYDMTELTRMASQVNHFNYANANYTFALSCRPSQGALVVPYI